MLLIFAFGCLAGPDRAVTPAGQSRQLETLCRLGTGKADAPHGHRSWHDVLAAERDRLANGTAAWLGRVVLEFAVIGRMAPMAWAVYRDHLPF
jgi:hypothetical protein